MNFKHAIIDMDPLVYKCGFSIEKFNKELDAWEVEPPKHAFYNINSMVKKCLRLSGTDEYTGYLTASGRGNFRFELFPEYKANRKDARRPFYYNEIREFCVNRWNAEIVKGQEADDSCSIKQCQLNNLGFDKDIRNSIVWSVDKDFNNIPGWHGNYTTGDIYYVEEIEALRTFYLQILTGDTSDGIPRIQRGWRKQVCEEKIKSSETEEEIYEIVYNEMYKVLGASEQEVTEELINRARLVWLRREPEQLWTPPWLKKGYQKHLMMF